MAEDRTASGGEFEPDSAGEQPDRIVAAGYFADLPERGQGTDLQPDAGGKAECNGRQAVGGNEEWQGDDGAMAGAAVASIWYSAENDLDRTEGSQGIFERGL